MLAIGVVVIKDETVPFPGHWHTVFVPWQRMAKQNPNCLDLLHWIENDYLGFARYQLRGPALDPTAGFLFYFEDSRDATVFTLKWL